MFKCSLYFSTRSSILDETVGLTNGSGFNGDSMFNLNRPITMGIGLNGGKRGAERKSASCFWINFEFFNGTNSDECSREKRFEISETRDL